MEGTLKFLRKKTQKKIYSPTANSQQIIFSTLVVVYECPSQPEMVPAFLCKRICAKESLSLCAPCIHGKGAKISRN